MFAALYPYYLNEYSEEPLAFDATCAHIAKAISKTHVELKSKNNTLTGDWVIFQKKTCSSENYFLSLARHEEEDSAIYDRIKMHLK